MFQLTKNFHQTWMNMAECAVFKQAAMKEAQKRFNGLLAEEGFDSEEQLKEALRPEGEVELYERAFLMESDADDLLERAGDPDISPEDSFEFLVQSMVIEERMRVYDEVIDEFRADDLESTDKN